MTAARLRRILRAYEDHVYLPLMDEFAGEDPIAEDLRNVRTAIIGQIELMVIEEAEAKERKCRTSESLKVMWS